MATFASFWFGDRLSGYEVLCIQSFLDHGHEFHLFTFGEGLRVPSGCIRRDAAEIVAGNRVFFYDDKLARGRVSAFSNMFRYQMIHDSGTCWVDLDVLCLDGRIETGDYVFAPQDEFFYNGAVLKFPPGHEAMRLAAEYCWEVRAEARWGDLGPHLLTSLVEDYDLTAHAWPKEIIYPVHWTEAEITLRPEHTEEVARRAADAKFLHLWNEMFTRAGVDKNRPPPAGCYLAEAVRRHDVAHCFAA